MPMRLIFHQHLPGPGPWNGHPVKPDLPGGRHHFLQHGFLHHTHTPLFGSRPVCREAGRVKSIYIMRVWEGKVKRIFVKNAQNIR